MYFIELQLFHKNSASHEQKRSSLYKDECIKQKRRKNKFIHDGILISARGFYNRILEWNRKSIH